MKSDLVSALRNHRISLLGPPSDTKLGFGRDRVPIVLEPFVEFRGGIFDIRRIDAFSYLGGRGSQYRHVGRIGRFCALGPGLVCGSPEHNINGITSHSLMYGQWSGKWPEIHSEFGINANQIEQGKTSLAIATEQKRKRITIGNDVWIGDGVFISRGVTIGDGAVIAARSTVVADVPPYAVMGGTPAKIIKWRFPREIIDRLLASCWWKYGLSILSGTEWTNIEKCLNEIERRIGAGFEPYVPQKIRILPDDSLEYFIKWDEKK